MFLSCKFDICELPRPCRDIRRTVGCDMLLRAVRMCAACKKKRGSDVLSDGSMASGFCNALRSMELLHWNVLSIVLQLAKATSVTSL